MKFRLYREYGALNSPPIFDAFARGLTSLGHVESQSSDSIPVIWSVLWHGRMLNNRNVYYQAKSRGIPVVIIEVGNLKRNTTWRISVDNVNGLGYFGNNDSLDAARPEKLGVFLSPIRKNRSSDILIATQHQKSLQWEGQPPVSAWLRTTIDKIRHYSDRRIVVRPHPRSPIATDIENLVIENPKKIIGTYDDFDINYDYHCVINFCSGPTIQSAMHGTPIICDQSGLAWPVSEKWENLETPQLPDREDWFIKLCHTEWHVEEIAQGLPLERITNYLEEKLTKKG